MGSSQERVLPKLDEDDLIFDTKNVPSNYIMNLPWSLDESDVSLTVDQVRTLIQTNELTPMRNTRLLRAARVVMESIAATMDPCNSGEKVSAVLKNSLLDKKLTVGSKGNPPGTRAWSQGLDRLSS